MLESDSSVGLSQGGQGVGQNAAFPGHIDTYYTCNGDGDANNAPGIFRVKQGAGASERIGRKILIKSIYFRGFIRCAEFANTKFPHNLNTVVRMMLIQDTQANGSIPTTTDIFDTYQSNNNDIETGGMNATLRVMRIENGQRFKVLMDKTFQVNDSSYIEYNVNAVVNGTANLDAAPTKVAMGGGVRYFQCYKKLNIPIEFGDATANPNQVKSNAIYLISSIVGNSAYIAANGRTRFLDV